MPIYEYQCTDCDNIFEQWCKCSQMEEVIPCPLCVAPSKHIISNTAFILKGSGWYVTEYGNKKNISDKKDAPVQDEANKNTKDDTSNVKPTSDSNKVSETKQKSPETSSSNTTAPTTKDN